MDSERKYVDLLFRASKKYASWDPEVVVEVGDWGRITIGRSVWWAFWRRRRGIFLKEGNIYKDGIAQEYEVPLPKERGADASHGVMWITSENALDLNVSGSLGGVTPAFASCHVKAAFGFTSDHGAVLAMDNDTISSIDPPGFLRRLFDEDKLQNCVIVSEVHRTSSYARYLSSPSSKTVMIGLSAEPPIPGVASVKADFKWISSTNAGNFKAKVNNNGNREYYPLFRLVSLKETDTSVGLRGSWHGDTPPPLPDAQPPWLTT